MKTIRVKSAAGNYAVVSGRGALRRIGNSLQALRVGEKVFILSSPNVWRHWGAPLLRSSRALDARRVVLFDDREAAKRLATVENICRNLADLRADRHSLLLAVGGGVVGDVAGFVAASYLRGVRIVHIPTTLMAQVDSAIGGKTGVNLPEGKNLVGAFYPPQIVLADPVVLRALPRRQFRSGIYEVIKYGVIGDPLLFNFLERELAAILRLDMRALEFIIERCARQKARIVGADEREGGLRQILNFGHTIGHALESLTHYRRFLHGEGVAWGMLAAAQIAVSSGHLAPRDAQRLASLIVRCGELPRLPAISSAELLRAISGDKKSRSGKVRWVLPRKIGAADFDVTVPDSAVAAVWRDLPAICNRARKAR